MFVDALVAWLVALLGDRAVKGITRVVRGSPEYQALQKAMALAINSALGDVRPGSRAVLEDALRERFAAPPVVLRDGRTRVRTGIIRAIQSQLAPLADPDITPSGQSFFEEIGVDGARLRDDLSDVVIRSIEQVGPGFPALTPLVTQLNADAIVEQVETVLDRINQLAASGTEPPLPALLSGGKQAGGARGTNGRQAMECSADIAERLTDAFLAVPTVADPESRAMVISLLPSNLRNSIPYNRYPRLHVLGMITAGQNQPNGLRALLRAVQLAEGDTTPMEKLNQVIIEIDNSIGDHVKDDA